MRWFTVISLSSASGVLGAAVPSAWEQQQKQLGRIAQISTSARWYMSREETYGKGWETCGNLDSRFCYSPDLGQSCCEIDNSYCDAGTWCAPVAGYCCLDTEDLEICARNAGFQLPGNETLGETVTAVT
ncbi:hypothetical protein C8A03DRAFT_29963 [Achaetomium macrosporum]|uniref:Granulins domain-containing protein n=1 Tax=Achaetomium macrosporum TaxID=79813 RepID=A0AAN7CI83_9PEZI|nr:hypothetical protein C8A03DRAFT_29963 [Achaetomium macrosporum]